MVLLKYFNKGVNDPVNMEIRYNIAEIRK